MKITFEQKLDIMRHLTAGESLIGVARRFQISRIHIETLYDRYRKYGEKGLYRKANGRFSPQEKEHIIRLHEEKGLSLRSLYSDYDVSSRALLTWLRKVRKEGYSALYEKKRRGRQPKNSMARPRKKEPQTELEKLQAENLRLRAENALLKKVKALVEEEEARARLNGQKSSTN